MRRLWHGMGGEAAIMQQHGPVSRRDVSEFLMREADLRIKPEIQEFALEEANAALI